MLDDWRIRAVFIDYFFFVLFLAFVGWVIGMIAGFFRMLAWGWRTLMERRRAAAKADDDIAPEDYGV